MDEKLYDDAIKYELLTQAIYQDILAREGDSGSSVKHNKSLVGRSGVEHQIDVLWEFKKAGVSHRVLIECKNYSSNLTLEKVRNFFAVVHDIGNCVGIMVTKTGYQSGAAAFAKHYGLVLKLLRKPTDDDWSGKIKKVHVNMIPRVPVSTIDRPIICDLFLRPSSVEQELRLKAAQALNPTIIQADPSLQFVDMNGTPVTDEMRWWLPRQLNVLNLADGGPYEQPVELTAHYIQVDLGGGSEFIQVIGVKIKFYVETYDPQQIIVDASETVSEILKDFETGEWDYVQRKI